MKPFFLEVQGPHDDHHGGMEAERQAGRREEGRHREAERM
jgi:hypothetical protein